MLTKQLCSYCIQIEKIFIIQTEINGNSSVFFFMLPFCTESKCSTRHVDRQMGINCNDLRFFAFQLMQHVGLRILIDAQSHSSSKIYAIMVYQTHFNLNIFSIKSHRFPLILNIRSLITQDSIK